MLSEMAARRAGAWAGWSLPDGILRLPMPTSVAFGRRYDAGYSCKEPGAGERPDPVYERNAKSPSSTTTIFRREGTRASIPVPCLMIEGMRAYPNAAGTLRMPYRVSENAPSNLMQTAPELPPSSSERFPLTDRLYAAVQSAERQKAGLLRQEAAS